MHTEMIGLELVYFDDDGNKLTRGQVREEKIKQREIEKANEKSVVIQKPPIPKILFSDEFQQLSFDETENEKNIVDFGDKEICRQALCLIGPNVVHKCTFSKISKANYSIDKIRLGFRYQNDDVDSLVKIFDKLATKYNGTSYPCCLANAKFRYMFVLRDSKMHSCTIGIGFNHPDGKIHPNGFIEFNPNKCEELGKIAVNKVIGFTKWTTDIEIKRFDLAIDFVQKRKDIRIVKDERNYELHTSNSLTEYLGQRDKPGRVKVYDKTKELKASGVLETDIPLTRVELTCDGDWDCDKILKKLPVVYTLQAFSEADVSGITKAFCCCVARNCEFGDSPVPWLQMVNKRTKMKIVDYLKENKQFTYDRNAIKWALGYAQDLCKASF